jgi:hypothetical protein
MIMSKYVGAYKIKDGKYVAVPEYKAWIAMKYRCLKPYTPNYKYYGARGITVCDRWLNSYENFLADMGPRPSISHSLDRIDFNGNYEPGNCRWATKAQQSVNRRNTKHKGCCSLCPHSPHFGMV